MRVTDEQVAALRAFLDLDSSYERLVRELADGGRLDGLGELVTAAFVTAARRHFTPTWTSAEVVYFTGRLRNSLRPYDVDLDPRATELFIRQALGDPAVSGHEDHAHAWVMMFALIQLTSDEQLDEDSLDAFVAEARAMADARLAAQHGG